VNAGGFHRERRSAGGIELMANLEPSMFAGHSMLCPYNCKGVPTGSRRG
jgi:hypothetical protein